MTPTRHQSRSNSLENCRILVIEDNAYVREAFELTLSSNGLNTLAVTTAEEALKIVRRERFDIIISDFRLPGMDGLEFFIKAKGYTSKSTKVLVSAYGFEGMVSDARAAGVQYFFEKPFSIPTMLDRLTADHATAPESPDTAPIEG